MARNGDKDHGSVPLSSRGQYHKQKYNIRDSHSISLGRFIAIEKKYIRMPIWPSLIVGSSMYWIVGFGIQTQ